MKKLWYTLLVFWHRLLGKSGVQAEWRARQALSKPNEMKEEIRDQAARAADFRFKCVCGQLLVKTDKVCHACGRGQYTPHWLRSFLRVFQGVLPTTAPATILVGVLIALGYVIQMRFGGGGLISPNAGNLFYDLGASMTPLTLGPQPWRAFTYTILHGGFMHLLFNGIVLAQIGPAVEGAFGSSRFLFGWVITGAMAVTIPGWLGFERSVIGASGAIFGLMGMAMVFGHRLGTSYGIQLRNSMVTWTVYSTIFGFMLGGVAHDAHFAGMAAGIAVALLLPPPERNPARHRLSPILLAFSIAWMGYALAAGIGWANAGRPIPASLPTDFKAMLVYKKAASDGADAVFDQEGKAFIDRACALREQGLEQQEADRLLMEALPYLRGLEASHQDLFRRMVIKCLYPDGRRPGNGRREAY